ncbi:Chromosome partition protein Smc [Maioricimonas rarisocia]|uniref:Chromosome partition protein Smc n=1 Tax=Maioricimonas rarisocia TaxID=2528026 RepID=A0A517Z135_9PLAN|nr:MlaD family protein [Maioricimonas rarisocia]QDU36185.1 Chromosome partition protein Smc [Maioricimonas rarisocia]
MSERQLQFRVGLFALLSLVVGMVLVVKFGEIQNYWQETYAIAIHFEEAPGLLAGTPVRQNGLRVGSVREVMLDDEAGGVLAIVDIRVDRKLRVDSQASLVRSLLGDAWIEFTAGSSPEVIPPNHRVNGHAPVDPMEIVDRMEKQVSTTLASFAATSREWERVGANVNSLMETRQGNLDEVIERAALSLEQFSRTMQTANTTLTSVNELVADPKMQQDLRDTVAALPAMVNETRQTISAARVSIEKVGENLDQVSRATEPLAENSRQITTRLAGSLMQLESLLTELNSFSKMLNSEDGSVQRFAADPELYENLNNSAAALTLLLRNLDPLVKDMRVFSDKVARHPEILGVSGALKGSSGIKESSEAQGPIRQTSGFLPQR